MKLLETRFSKYMYCDISNNILISPDILRKVRLFLCDVHVNLHRKRNAVTRLFDAETGITFRNKRINFSAINVY